MGLLDPPATAVGRAVASADSGASARTAVGAGVCATMTALKSIATISAALGATDGHVKVLGYSTPGDGGGGVFRWDSTDTTTADNGGTVIAPTSGPAGRWKRVYEGEVNARWFGMHPSSSDNTAALQRAVDWVSTDQTRNPAGGYGAGTVYIPMGYYRFTFDQGTSGLSTITIAGNYVTIRGEGSGTTLTVRSHAYPSQLNSFFTFAAGFKALGGGIRDLCINGNSMLKWAISLDTWHGIEFDNIYVTDVHSGILDAYSTISPNCGESVYVRHCEYQCTSGTNSCFTQYGIRFRSSAGASWSDCWVSDCNFIGIWDTGVVLDGVIRFSVNNIGVSSNYATTNTIDGTSKGGVKHTVTITHTVDGTWSGGNGQHILDGLYHESHEGNEDVTNFAAVLIEAPTGGGAYNRYNRVSNVNTSWNTTVAPAIFRITNDNAVDNRVMDNTFTGNRRPITTEGQVYVGSLVRNTQLNLTPNVGGLSSISLLDLGIRTRINNQASLTYRNSALWPDNKRGQAEFDVGEISRDALTGRLIIQDKNNDSVLIGPRPGVDVVAPYGAQRIQAMSTPDAPTVVALGTGSTTWSYYVVGIDKDGNKTIPSAAGSTTTGPATLTSSTYNAVQWFPIPGAVKYDLLRGSTATAIATNLVVTHFNDGGSSTSAYTPAASNPAGNLTVDGTITGRRAPRVSLTANPGSWTPNLASFDHYYASGLSSTLTINAVTGTANDGEDLWFRLRDAGTSQTIVWSSSYREVGAVRPTSTTAGKVHYIHCKWNATSSVMDVIDVKTQA